MASTLPWLLPLMLPGTRPLLPLLPRKAICLPLSTHPPFTPSLALPFQVRLYDVGSARLLRHFTVSGQRPSQPAAAGAGTAISWFPDSGRVLAATHKAVEVFDARHGGGGLVHRLPSPHAFTYDVLVAGSDCLITVGQDRKIGFTRCVRRLCCWFPACFVPPCGPNLSAVVLSVACLSVIQLPHMRACCVKITCPRHCLSPPAG